MDAVQTGRSPESRFDSSWRLADHGSAGSQKMTSLLHDLAARPLTHRNRFGAWLAMLTCPCHAVALLYLGIGTTWGATLFAYREWMFGALGAAFVAGLWLLFRPTTHVCALPAQPTDQPGRCAPVS
jgi:hypothetical protein